MFGRPRSAEAAAETPTPQIPDVPVVPVRSSLNERKHERLLNFSQQEILGRFTRIEASLKDIIDPAVLAKAETTEPRYYYKIMNAFRQAKQRWLAVDLRRLNDTDAATVYDVLEEALPRLAAKVAGSAIITPLLYIADVIAPEVKVEFDRIDTVIRNQNDLDYRVDEVSQVGQVIFPDLITITPQVDVNVVRLRQLWFETMKKTNTREDEFFLEQVANSYLPDAWRMFSGLDLADTVIRERAEALLGEHLALIEQRVRDILNRALNQNVDALEAQRNFLAEKLRPEQSGLHLG